MAMRKGLMLLCAASIFLAAPAHAIPPPPPSPDGLKVAQAFIRASIDKDLPLYSSLLSDQFMAADPEANKIVPKAEWLNSMAEAFQNKWLQIKILHVFYGDRIVGTGLQYQIMIVERLANYPDPPHSDCCTFYRTETLILDGDKVSRLIRSIPFDSELSDTGKRTDIPN